MAGSAWEPGWPLSSTVTCLGLLVDTALCNVRICFFESKNMVFRLEQTGSRQVQAVELVSYVTLGKLPSCPGFKCIT